MDFNLFISGCPAGYEPSSLLRARRQYSYYSTQMETLSEELGASVVDILTNAGRPPRSEAAICLVDERVDAYILVGPEVQYLGIRQKRFRKSEG